MHYMYPSPELCYEVAGCEWHKTTTAVADTAPSAATATHRAGGWGHEATAKLMRGYGEAAKQLQRGYSAGTANPQLKVPYK